ncbi:MAG: pyroglutamyl-peptidase I [Hyphomicrobiaceae bacterium]
MQRLVDRAPTRRHRPASRSATLLLTAFGPFPGVPSNQSKHLVARLAALARQRWSRLHVATLLLPTEWVRAPLLIEVALDRWQPDVALHFGVSGAASGFDVEWLAENRSRPLRDACGRLPELPHLDPEAGRHMTGRRPAHQIHRHLRQNGHSCRLSHDAGRYLCNAVYYHSLRHARLHAPDRMVAFVHIPKRLRVELHLRGAMRAVEAALAAGGPALARRLRS